jgi:small subunit ribosomal protein S8
MQHDTMADALSAMKNAEKVGKRKCSVPKSKILISVLEVFKKYNYIRGFDTTETRIRVELAGKINECKAIRPRFSIIRNEYEKFEKRYLPAKDIGILVISTSKGVMSQKEAHENKIGGRILAMVY